MTPLLHNFPFLSLLFLSTMTCFDALQSLSLFLGTEAPAMMPGGVDLHSPVFSALRKLLSSTTHTSI